MQKASSLRRRRSMLRSVVWSWSLWQWTKQPPPMVVSFLLAAERRRQAEHCGVLGHGGVAVVAAGGGGAAVPEFSEGAGVSGRDDGARARQPPALGLGVVSGGGGGDGAAARELERRLRKNVPWQRAAVAEIADAVAAGARSGTGRRAPASGCLEGERPRRRAPGGGGDRRDALLLS